MHKSQEKLKRTEIHECSAAVKLPGEIPAVFDFIIASGQIVFRRAARLSAISPP